MTFVNTLPMAPALRIGRLALFGLLLCLTAPSSALACFGDDRGAFLTDPGAHRSWAQPRDAAAISANLLVKIDALGACAISDGKLRDAFAESSAVISRHVPRPACFNGDVAAANATRQQHRDWASVRARQDIVANLRWKAAAAIACLEHQAQVDYFGDISVTLAAAAKDTGTPPTAAGVVWKLANATFKDTAPSATKALRIDDTHADAKGGFVRITVLNDGECAPQAGMPASGMQQRFLFRWEFDREIGQLAFPEKVGVRLSIDGDDNVPCFAINPIMTIGAEGRVLASTNTGRFRWKPSPDHDARPRAIEVVGSESGLERSSVVFVPSFQIAIWGFRGNRGMQLEAQYIYALASPPPR